MRAALFLPIFALACSGEVGSNAPDLGTSDAGTRDLGSADLGPTDIGPRDLGTADAGKDIGTDASFDDATPSDAPIIDTGEPPQLQTLSFTAIEPSAPEIVAPGRGVEQWHDRSDVDVPTEGAPIRPRDVYWRMYWNQLHLGQGSYDWSLFDERMDEAIQRRQRMSFGIMTICPGCGGPEVDGADLYYPEFVHDAMQAESEPDWISPMADMWVPNWNSEALLSATEDFNAALNDHLETTSFMGVRYRDAVGYIDVRHYGSWGEWHHGSIVGDFSEFPNGTVATAASLIRIIDSYVDGYPDQQLVSLLATFDAMWLNNTQVPAEVGYHALTVSNRRGKLGWRRDNWGRMDNYLSDYLENNDRGFNGLTFSDAIMSRWQEAPIVGEPPGYTTESTCEYDDVLAQVLRYHATSFGNGNYGGADGELCMRDNIRAASKAMGYRIVLTGGTASANIGNARQLEVHLDWQNVGLTPPYFDWQVVFELRDSNGAVWSGTSAFSPRLFLPAATPETHGDAFSIPSTLAAGDYALHLSVVDPTGFLGTLPLAIEGAQSDGSYVLGSVTVP